MLGGAHLLFSSSAPDFQVPTDLTPPTRPPQLSNCCLASLTQTIISSLVYLSPTRPSSRPLCNVKRQVPTSVRFSLSLLPTKRLAVSFLPKPPPSRRRSFPAFLAVTQHRTQLPRCSLFAPTKQPLDSTLQIHSCTYNPTIPWKLRRLEVACI